MSSRDLPTRRHTSCGLLSRRSSTALASAVLAACLAAAPAPALAEEAAAEAPYYEHIRDALQLMNAGRHAEARERFQQAHALSPSARTHRALGIVEFELRHYAQAVVHFEAALAHPVRRLTPELRAEVEQMASRAAQFVGRYELRLRPADASFTVDGEAAALQPDGTLLLDLGRHELLSTAKGHLPMRRVLLVRGGDQDVLEVTLMPDPRSVAAASGPIGRAAPPPPQPSTPRESTSIHERWWFWTAAGVVVAGAVTGLVVALQPEERQAPIEGNLGPTRVLLQVAP